MAAREAMTLTPTMAATTAAFLNRFIMLSFT
jgi:hypothetical protein